MSNELPNQLSSVYTNALSRARVVLEDLGFSFTNNTTAVGQIRISGLKAVDITVTIPGDFPDALPIIHIDRSILPRTVAHIEEDGKICIAPSTGVLLDSDNIDGLIYESIDKARESIKKGLDNENYKDIAEEFTAYWTTQQSKSIWSIFDPEKDSRVVCEVDISNENERKVLISESKKQAEGWTLNAGWKIDSYRTTFYIRLEYGFIPPKFEEKITVDQLQGILKKNSPKDYKNFLMWFNKRDIKLPLILLMSVPNNSEIRSLFAVFINKPSKELQKGIQKGFRSKRVPDQRLFSFISNQEVTRLDVERRDYKYLLSRGSLGFGLYSESVTVIGCGSIGSRIIENLALVGVGHIKIVDHENISVENVHRHVLGSDSVGKPKVSELKILLRKRFPHIQIEDRKLRVQEVISSELSFITDSSLVIIALGDETLELRINNILHSQVKHMHVWLEPLDVGGHILATGIQEKNVGCYQCLFARAENIGLYNQSSFIKAGQKIQKSMAGCAGVFSPYSALHANRAAMEATRLASQILQNQVEENILISWIGETQNFIDMGFHLSEKGLSFVDGEVRKQYRFHDLNCPICKDFA